MLNVGKIKNAGRKLHIHMKYVSCWPSLKCSKMYINQAANYQLLELDWVHLKLSLCEVVMRPPQLIYLWLVYNAVIISAWLRVIKQSYHTHFHSWPYLLTMGTTWLWLGNRCRRCVLVKTASDPSMHVRSSSDFYKWTWE